MLYNNAKVECGMQLGVNHCSVCTFQKVMRWKMTKGYATVILLQLKLRKKINNSVRDSFAIFKRQILLFDNHRRTCLVKMRKNSRWLKFFLPQKQCIPLFGTAFCGAVTLFGQLIFEEYASFFFIIYCQL